MKKLTYVYSHDTMGEMNEIINGSLEKARQAAWEKAQDLFSSMTDISSTTSDQRKGWNLADGKSVRAILRGEKTDSYIFFEVGEGKENVVEFSIDANGINLLRLFGVRVRLGNLKLPLFNFDSSNSKVNVRDSALVLVTWLDTILLQGRYQDLPLNTSLEGA